MVGIILQTMLLVVIACSAALFWLRCLDLINLAQEMHRSKTHATIYDLNIIKKIISSVIGQLFSKERNVYLHVQNLISSVE